VKDFLHDPKFVQRETRDALNYMVGPTHYVMFDAGRHYVKIGYQYDYENAEGSNWSYSGNRLLVGFQYTLPWYEIQLRYDYDRHWRSHTNRHSLLPTFTPFTKKRHDSENLHTATLSKDFRWADHKFNVALDYLFDDTNSNFSAFTFTRHVVMPSIGWRF
jgi:hypothetical protein